MPSFTTLMPETPVSFHARRWLLCGTPWEALPESLRQAPWAAWRHGCGLLHSCAPDDLSGQLSALLQEHAQSHVTVLAPDATPAERHVWRHAAPDADAAERVSFVFDLPTLEALLTQPETECSEWLGRDGQVLLPVPLDLTDVQREGWQALMTAWTDGCLQAVHDEVIDDLRDDLNGTASLPPEALAAKARELVLERARLLHGVGDDDTPAPATELDGAADTWGANDDLYQPLRLFGASVEAAPNEFHVAELQATLRVNLRHRPALGRATLDDDSVALELSFVQPPQMAQGSQLMRIELFDKTPADHDGWAPLPIVLMPTAKEPVGPWLIDGAEHPGLAQRWEQWLHGRPALGAEVWVSVLPSR